MPNDLAHEFGGAAVIGFGAAWVALQGHGASGEEQGAELEVTLFTEAEFVSGFEGTEVSAVAFEEHGELEGDLIVLAHGEIACGANEGMLLGIEKSHEKTSM